MSDGRRDLELRATGRRGDLSANSSLGATAYDRLREAIRDGSLKSGARLREENVAKTLDMSRTPVREALRRLELEGLLTHEPYRGMVVSRLDTQMVTELYLMRDVLEGTAARLAAQHASKTDIAVFRDLLAAEAQLKGKPERLAEHNRRFHVAVYHAAHNRFLLKTLNALRDSLDLLGGTTFAVPGRAKSALKEHREIVAAIAAGDAEAAEAAARSHIQGAQRARMKLFSQAR